MKRPDWAKTKTAFEGNRYAISCSWHGDGQVFNYDDNRVELKFRNEPKPRTLMYGLIQLPDFVVSNPDGSEECRFCRTRRFFPQVFEIRASHHQLGEVVRPTPVIRNYNVELSGGVRWNLWLPLFTVGFFGTTSDGGKLLFWLKSHLSWQLVVDKKHNSSMLIASLAFIHREYLRHQ